VCVCVIFPNLDLLNLFCWNITVHTHTRIYIYIYICSYIDVNAFIYFLYTAASSPSLNLNRTLTRLLHRSGPWIRAYRRYKWDQHSLIQKMSVTL